MPTDRLFLLCTIVLVASLVLGGGTRTGFLSDAVIQLLAIPLLLIAVRRLAALPSLKGGRWALALCLAIALIPALQLVPLPPSVWTALPGRAPAMEAFQLLGQGLPWMPLSLSPRATWLSALSLLPPIAIFLATLLIGYRERRTLSPDSRRLRCSQRLRRPGPGCRRPVEQPAVLRDHQSLRGGRLLRQPEPFRRGALCLHRVCGGLGG